MVEASTLSLQLALGTQPLHGTGPPSRLGRGRGHPHSYPPDPLLAPAPAPQAS